MQQVDFYLISNSITDAKFKLASRLSSKLQKLDKRALIVTTDNDNASQLDQLMWRYSDTSFVAHDILIDSNNTGNSNIHITSQEAFSSNEPDQQKLQDYDVLINLTSEHLTINEQFNRIAEIVSADEQDRQYARQRYQRYKNNQATLNMHEIEL